MISLPRIVDAVTAFGASVLRVVPDRVPMLEAAGELVEIGEEPFAAGALERVLVEALDAEGRARLASAHEVDAWLVIDGGARLAARIVRGAKGLSARIRVARTIARSFDALGCPESVRRVAERRSGLVLVTGLRGAGKTTLAAGMLDLVNQTRVSRILTLERPIEIAITEARAALVQREIGSHAPSFASALADAARQDLDAVFVADLPDAETALAALELASTGALVIAVVPARGAVAAIREVLAIAAECAREADDRARGLLGDSLAGVVAVKLAPRAEGRGHVAAHEVLLGSAALAAMIREDRLDEATRLMTEGASAGMQTFDAALERLVMEGIVRPEHAATRVVDRAAFERAIARRGMV